MHMVRHQAISPDIRAGLRRRDAEPVPIKPVIGIAEERPLATIAALRDVVKDPGDHQARYPSHDTSIAEVLRTVNCRRSSSGRTPWLSPCYDIGCYDGF